MDIIAPEHGVENRSSVKRKANVTRDIRVAGRKKATRAASHAPEVMAKVTGFSKGASHARSNIDYISRNGETKLENDRGEIIEGRAEVKAFAKEWVAEFDDKKRYKDQRDTMHLIMSMPAGTDPEAVRLATRQFAKQTFGHNHEYVFALHTDTASPHTHITIKTLGHNGKRLNPRKDDLQRYRESFADAMEEQGYMANATARNVRGVVRKSQRQNVRHIEKRGVSYVHASKVKQAARELVDDSKGTISPDKPWVRRIKDAQDVIRQNWLDSAKMLRATVIEELDNERPNYGRRADGRRASDVRAVAEQLRRRGTLAGVHQPGAGQTSGRGPTESVTGMRNLSSGTLVQKQTVSKMLLHPNALDIVGDRNGSSPDHEVRRTGAGLASNGRSNGKSQEEGRKREEVEQPMATRLSDKELAALVETFVQKMPPVETEHDQIKRDLKVRFTRPSIERAAVVLHDKDVAAGQDQPEPDRDN